ncbi:MULTISPECIES: cytochrome c biogenesis protein ResB [unclassified Acidovorax]|uniref:cytochrome c biogenesis protein ResB n=1 Tax=unclassified Acidovorax TaxID=2684926 RepID=UPI000BDD47DB|nr:MULTISPECIES: cytochrome c biogenesis protein ResB [unclassified Acidovorax]OZA56897.1 MAG: cytochrome C biogenesis protein ResB [Acidovorax sp. 17-64-282]HQS22499.1 cytochrome c biogenesis protein ResB [Acidovorax defluvii]OYY26972.1 MAG: cytochrome C biogenesis protein ResB [Acidovorax sp. 35-64-16]OYZ44753.1 MAG: cytochrome C biogenesis protein ResB [Acidovorax sp. 16-64-162]OZA68909.1 MAG: cytochrome C biogenesis protein ResB [Acidovorax sp. 39-64-12]
MSDTTQGVQVRSGSQALRAGIELLSSMRFAISLLTVICIASVIGTVLKQHEPAVNYVNQFGPFWAELFAAIQLNAVYSAWWFLLILAFLVVSTSLCIARNTPKILVDLKVYKENIREQSLRSFHHKAEGSLAEPAEAAARRIGSTLASGGWKVKLQQRDSAKGAGPGWMVAAKAGAANKIGYIAAHSAIVLICLGGLFDGDLIVRAQMLLGGKTPYAGSGLISEVKPEHRLSERNPTFRGNLVVAEGTQSGTAILSQSDGVLLQDLPFAIELKKFIVEHYSTGMPKLFASEVIIHDKATGEKTPARIEVNHPASYKGIEIYQSSFDDGGSHLKLRAVPMTAGAKAFDIEGTVGGSTELVGRGGDTDGEKLTLEFTALRTINVENFGDVVGAPGSGVDVRKVDLRESVESRLGAANKTVTKKELRNVGPSVSYKLRDAAGQAREFHNYMLPVDTGDGVPVFLLGVRENPSDPFRYLRVPADEQSSMEEFMRLYAALGDPAAREEAVRRYVALAVEPSRPELAAQLSQSALRALALFAGSNGPDGKTLGGLQAISDFMEANVPEAERSRAGEVLVRILNGALFELAQLTRERAGLKPMEQSDQTQAFMTQAVLSLSDAQIYPAPLAFELKDFTQVQASVFQVARAPGKNIVYLGCALLILGVFAMLYVRERRVWVWVAPQGDQSHALMALSTNRKTMDGDREFVQLAEKLIGARPH